MPSNGIHYACHDDCVPQLCSPFYFLCQDRYFRSLSELYERILRKGTCVRSSMTPILVSQDNNFLIERQFFWCGNILHRGNGSTKIPFFVMPPKGIMENQIVCCGYSFFLAFCHYSTTLDISSFDKRRPQCSCLKFHHHARSYARRCTKVILMSRMEGFQKLFKVWQG